MKHDNFSLTLPRPPFAALLVVPVLATRRAGVPRQGGVFVPRPSPSRTAPLSRGTAEALPIMQREILYKPEAEFKY